MSWDMKQRLHEGMEKLRNERMKEWINEKESMSRYTDSHYDVAVQWLGQIYFHDPDTDIK